MPSWYDFGFSGNAYHRAKRRQENCVARKTHDLGLDLDIFPRISEKTHLANIDARNGRLDYGSDHLDDLALDVDGLRVLDGAAQHFRYVVERRSHRAPPLAHRGTEVTEAQREEGDKGDEGDEEDGEDGYPFIILTKPSTNLSMPKFMSSPK